MNKNLLIAFLLLVISPFALALDFGDLVTDVIKDRNISTKKILGAIKSISKVTSGQSIDGAPKDAGSSVIIFSATWCGYCVKALDYMDSNNIPYINKDIDESDNEAEYKKLGGSSGVPYIIFGDKTMYGFNQAAFDKRYAVFQQEQAAKMAAEKEAVIQSGDRLKGKIAGVNVYKKPVKSSTKLLKLGKEDQVIYMGEEQGGYFLVTTEEGEGWVDKLLVQK